MPQKAIHSKVKITANKKIGPDYCKMSLRAPDFAKRAMPGQFVQIKVNGAGAPLLRRPLSIHRVNGESIELLYEVVGRGTGLLSQGRAGEHLDIIGPLGNGFDYGRSAIGGKQCILVAGGMGVAPLLFLAAKLAKVASDKSHAAGLVLIGAKTKRHILCQDEFQKYGFEVKIATDDGSAGFKGKVTDLLRNILHATCDMRHATLFACGPRPMLKEVAALSAHHKVPAQVSLEEHMACGLGACLGCVVKTRNGQERVCKEGPVFGADEIIWQEGGR